MQRRGDKAAGRLLPLGIDLAERKMIHTVDTWLVRGVGEDGDSVSEIAEGARSQLRHWLPRIGKRLPG